MRQVARMLGHRPVHTGQPLCKAASSTRIRSITSGPAVSSAVSEQQMKTVAAWRLALLQTYSNKFTDFSMAFRVKGVTFDNRQALVRQLHPGQGVIFYREPSNPADPHAVAVYTAGMQQLGYLPRYTAQSWQLQTSFGQVVAAGPAGGVGLWGAVVKCKGAVHSICLDLLPDSWQRQADIKEALGAQQWAEVQQQACEQYGNRCAISSIPSDQLQQPLHVIPQWRFDYLGKQVELAGIIPVCEPINSLIGQLAAAADQLAALAPDLQLQTDAPASSSAAPAHAAGALDQPSNQARTAARDTTQTAGPLQSGEAAAGSIGTSTQAVATAHAEAAAAAAVAGLPVEQQEAVRWLGTLTPWPEVDCVKYVAYAGWRRQQLLVQEGWHLLKPDAQQVAGLLPSKLQ